MVDANLHVRVGGEWPNAERLDQWTLGKVEHIDCVFLSESGIPLWGWEVEASTPITTGVDHFIDLPKINADLNVSSSSSFRVNASGS